MVNVFGFSYIGIRKIEITTVKTVTIIIVISNILKY